MLGKTCKKAGMHGCQALITQLIVVHDELLHVVKVERRHLAATKPPSLTCWDGACVSVVRLLIYSQQCTILGANTQRDYVAESCRVASTVVCDII